MLTDGIYALRDSEHDVLTLKKSDGYRVLDHYDFFFWKEPHAKGDTLFVTDKEIIIKGIVFAGMVLVDEYVTIFAIFFSFSLFFKQNNNKSLICILKSGI